MLDETQICAFKFSFQDWGKRETASRRLIFQKFINLSLSSYIRLSVAITGEGVGEGSNYTPKRNLFLP